MTQYSATQLAEKLGCHRASIAKIRERYKVKGGIPGEVRLGHIWTYTDESAKFIKGLKPGRKLGSKNGVKEIIKGE